MVNQLESSIFYQPSSRQKKTNIQNIIFPKLDICTVEELFFRSNSNVLFNYENQILELNLGGIVSFDTYFNGFCVEKWKSHTRVKNISADIELQGSFKITICNVEPLGESKSIVSQKLVDTKSLDTINILERFDISSCTGMIYIEIEALSNGCQIHGGCLYSDTEPEPDIKLAVVICTYKRENYIYKNINLLEKYLLNQNDWQEKIQLFIIDNGNSLERFHSSLIHVIPNKNAGGSGGFTRGMLEVLEHKDIFSHIILMDDDVTFEPEIFNRVWNFLSLGNKKNLCLGSSMLRLDKKYIQHERGAYWHKDKGFIAVKHQFDLRKLSDTLANEIDEHIEYSAWWFFCFPLDAIKNHGLPYPFFIRMDDVEFCKRIKIDNKIIILNGICVWHEPFENKQTPTLEYYYTRNSLIFNSLHFHEYFSTINAIKWFLKPVLRELFLYRYETAEKILTATRDYLQGPHALVAIKPEDKHKELSKVTEKTTKNTNFKFIYNKYLESQKQTESTLHRYFRLLTLNGNLLPSWFFFKDDTLTDQGYKIVPFSESRPINVFRAKKVLYYNLQIQEGFVVQFSRIRFFQLLGNALWLALLMFFKFSQVKNLYVSTLSDFTNQDFWRKYLEIEKTNNNTNRL